ncbi:cation diffusion facilitator family transporter [Nocardioides panacisoli]|uniref:Cation efflux protein transmembrane domain-containing protein n=1 Tax=Nocardioides panacisoli TaxID=627624 RepID=A0ABP7IXF1_9ACTN
MTQRRRITVVLALNLVMIAGLVVAGLAAHSIGLLSEGGDFLADSAALGLGMLAIHLRDRHRNRAATTWVALVNGVWLLVLSVGLAVAAVRRLVSGSPEVHGWTVLVVSAIAAVAMLAAALLLGADAASEDLHMRSILLDTIADGAAAAVVAVVGLVIALADRWYWLDSAAALLVSAVVLLAVVNLLRDVVRALRAGTTYEPSLDD